MDQQPHEEDCKVDLADNPWAVESLEDFLHYCCPECDVKSQSRDFFLDHALLNHPLVRKICEY